MAPSGVRPEGAVAGPVRFGGSPTATASRSTTPASAGLRRTAIRLATVVTTRTPTITGNDSPIPISVRHGPPAVEERQVVLVQGVQDELDADEAEDDPQPVGQVHQLGQQAAEQEVQLPQAHEREGVHGEDQERLLGQPEDRGDRVEGEQEVRRPDREHDDQHRGHHPPPADADERARAVVVVGNGQQAAKRAQGRVLRELGVVVLAALPGEVDGRDESTAANR